MLPRYQKSYKYFVGKLGDRSKQGDCFCIQADFQLQGNMKEEAVQSLNHAVQAYKDAGCKVELKTFESLF